MTAHVGALTPPAPGWIRLATEARAGWDLTRLVLATPALLRQPKGNGRTVMTVPGFGTNDVVLAPLQSYLRYLDHRPVGWGLGVNTGDDVPALVELLGERVLDVFADVGKPIDMVGWSLGGYLAREVARDHPHAVRRIVTMGSPIIGGPKYTVSAELFRRRGVDVDEIEQAIIERDDVPLRTPVTAMWSKNDGVVAYEACIDRVNPTTENIEVSSAHIGFGVDPEVWKITARALAA